MQQAAVRYRIKGSKVYVPAIASVTPGAAPGGSPYDGASHAPRLARWQGSSASPNSIVSGSLTTLRNRSRERRRNDGIADAGVEVLVSNIISTGIKPQFKTRDADLNKELAARWLTWTDECDSEGLFDFYGMQALACGSMITNGDQFTRLRARRPEDGLSVPLQLQSLTSDFCPVEKTEMLSGGNYIVNGVEFNSIGRRVAFWLYREHPGDMMMRRYDNQPVRVPAEEVIHLARIREAGVVRGEPWLARALVSLHEYAQYRDGQAVRQKIASLFTGFVRPNADGFFSGAEPANSEGKALAPLQPGLMQELQPGEDVTFSTPPDAGPTYEPFQRGELSNIATSIGVLYEQLTGDYRGMNDRTWRAALNEFGMRLGTWQHHLIVFQYCRPILRRWTEYAVLSGAIRLPKGITVAEAAAAKWLPPARPYIQPAIDIQAKVAEIRGGLRSRSEVVSERGYDAENVDVEIAADNSRSDQLGLILDSDPRNTASNGASQVSDPQPSSAEKNGE